MEICNQTRSYCSVLFTSCIPASALSAFCRYFKLYLFHIVLFVYSPVLIFLPIKSEVLWFIDGNLVTLDSFFLLLSCWYNLIVFKFE